MSANSKLLGVVGLDDFNKVYLTDHLRDVEHVEFEPLLTREEVMLHDPSFPFEERLEQARNACRDLGRGCDGVITYWDFPSTAFAAFVAEDLGLRYPNVESVIKCEHKLWSREEQHKAVETPHFCAFDPFDDDPLAEITLDFPFWVKPVVGHSSMLGFEIKGREDFESALSEIRDNIRELTKPFRYVIEHTDMPDHLKRQGATLCIAEQIISGGNQHTLEGYVDDGEVVIYGVVDSLRMDNEHTFSSYRYPSELDGARIGRMEEATRMVMHQFGYDNGPFNIEFFHDAKRDYFHLLEINSRISQSHSELFLKVDGQPHQQIAVDLALDREPRWRCRAGEFGKAGKFFLRRFEDARVVSVPDDEAIRRLHERMPDVRVKIAVEPGQRLGELEEQESYSYEIADLFIGGRDDDELEEKFEACRDLLQFEFEPVRG